MRENLNGEWVGTGFISDGNYYAGSKSRLDAIHDYGFCAPLGWGWALPYKLNPETSLIEAVQLSGISLRRFIDAVRQQINQNVEECWLEVLYQQSHDNAFRAVLMGYDGVVDSAIDHYAIYNRGQTRTHGDEIMMAEKMSADKSHLLAYLKHTPGFAQHIPFTPLGKRDLPHSRERHEDDYLRRHQRGKQDGSSPAHGAAPSCPMRLNNRRRSASIPNPPASRITPATMNATDCSSRPKPNSK